MNANIQKIVNRITNLIRTEYIYYFETGTGEAHLKWLLVLYPEGALSLQQDQKELISGMLENQSGYVLRLYSLQYALRQLQEGNLFFLRVYDKSNLVYSKSEEPLEHLMDDLTPVQALERAESRFDRDYNRVGAFNEGALFYVEREDFSQALFMTHQVMELGSRLMEIMLVGKEKVCHDIRDHLKHLSVFVPEFELPFDLGGETALVRLLDSAYKEVRYGNDIQVSEAQITLLKGKSEKMLKHISKLFHKHLEAIRDRFAEVMEESDGFCSPEQVRKTREKIKRLLKKKFFKYTPDSDRIYHRGRLPLNRPQDVLFGVSSLIKVCIMALHTMESDEHTYIPFPNIHLKSVLEMAVELLPYEEVEYIEDLIGVDNIDEHIPSVF
ncbi:hypothetical protein [Sinomicrobium soli]|uniref:hypothetical protein n=1 Tax=Sinomicrobium sp. N-1-3-6 TaxID=2219864 RepID=UPI000DCD1F75|nr:hypothetical protein [Sinomicrobium sp. N-1-3-6]RAV29307.1 hypothetical protein DN748_10375 [Sinomicrobium sp. N-1-3-6]